MKRKITLTLTAIIFCLAAIAQPQWRFHVAFEDATGAKDTIWMVWDTTAHGTLPTDTALDEGAFNFNYNAFNVWVYNYDGDSTKTAAYPYIAYPSHSVEIRAFNHQYPLTISWDTSLFHSSFLPFTQGSVNRARIDNDYFFLVNNCPPCQYYNMLTTDTVTAPAFWWGSQSQFPLNINIFYDPTGIEESEIKSNSQVFPNPCRNYFKIQSNVMLKSLEIKNMYFETVRSIALNQLESEIDISFLPGGVYLITTINQLNQIHHEKIIKHN